MKRSLTDETIAELERCLARFKEHRRHVEAGKKEPYSFDGVTRATARRASLDLTRMLAKWRKAYTGADKER